MDIHVLEKYVTDNNIVDAVLTLQMIMKLGTEFLMLRSEIERLNIDINIDARTLANAEMCVNVDRFTYIYLDLYDGIKKYVQPGDVCIDHKSLVVRFKDEETSQVESYSIIYHGYHGLETSLLDVLNIVLNADALEALSTHSDILRELLMYADIVKTVVGDIDV